MLTMELQSLQTSGFPRSTIGIGKRADIWLGSRLLAGYSGSWHATKVHVSRGGDVAYVLGAYDAT